MKSHSICASAKLAPKQYILLSLALLAFALFVLLFNLGGASTLMHHEALVAVTAREMVFSGDWLVPHFAGVPRLEKTPLAYWAVAGLGLLFGGVSEWTVRLPAALSGVALTGLVGTWAYRWYGINVGLCAALIQLTSLYTIKWGRSGTTDMLLCLLTTAALYVAAKVAVEPRDSVDSSTPARGYYLGISWCFFVGLAALAKPLFGILMVAAPCLVFLILHHRVRFLAKLIHPIGLLLFLMLALLWPYLVLQEIPSAWRIWQNETLHRAIDTGRYYQPFWFYAAVVPFLILPWTPVVLLSVPASWTRAWNQSDAKERFLWVWFLTQMSLLTLSSGKNQHYVLPALPALSLIGGQGCARWLARLDWEKAKLGSRSASLTAIGCIIVALSATGILSRQWPESLLIPLWSCSTVFIIGTCLALYFMFVSCPLEAAVTILGVYVVIDGVSAAQISPARDAKRPAVEFARGLEQYFPRERKMLVYKASFTALFFYVDPLARREDTLAGMQDRLLQEPELYVVTEIEMISELRTIGQVRTVAAMAPSAGQQKSPRLVLLELSAGKAE